MSILATNRIAGLFAAVIVSAAMPTAALALPQAALDKQGKTNLVVVQIHDDEDADDYGEHRRHRWHHRHHGEHVVDAPFTHVESGRRVIVDAPFAQVYVGHHGRRIVAPFVDLWLPR